MPPVVYVYFHSVRREMSVLRWAVIPQGVVIYAPAITVAGAEFFMWKYIEKIDWCKVWHRFLGLKHKALEMQAAYFGTDFFDINCSWRRRQDHAGMSFEITLLGVLFASLRAAGKVSEKDVEGLSRGALKGYSFALVNSRKGVIKSSLHCLIL